MFVFGFVCFKSVGEIGVAKYVLRVESVTDV